MTLISFERTCLYRAYTAKFFTTSSYKQLQAATTEKYSYRVLAAGPRHQEWSRPNSATTFSQTLRQFPYFHARGHGFDRKSSDDLFPCHCFCHSERGSQRQRHNLRNRWGVIWGNIHYLTQVRGRGYVTRDAEWIIAYMFMAARENENES